MSAYGPRSTPGSSPGECRDCRDAPSLNEFVAIAGHYTKTPEKLVENYSERDKCEARWEQSMFFSLSGHRLVRMEVYRDASRRDAALSAAKMCRASDQRVSGHLPLSMSLKSFLASPSCTKVTPECLQGPAHGRCVNRRYSETTNDGQVAYGTKRECHGVEVTDCGKASDEMVMAKCNSHSYIQFQNIYNPEYATRQAAKMLASGVRKDRVPDIEIHLLDSVSRAVFQFRFPRTMEWLRSLQSSDAIAVFQFYHYNTVGYGTRNNVPTLIKGCLPADYLSEASARFAFVGCQDSLLTQLSRIGYAVAHLTLSRETWTEPIVDQHNNAVNADQFIDGCKDVGICVEPWEWPYAASNWQKDAFGRTSTDFIHHLMLRYLEQYHTNYHRLPKFVLFHSMHNKIRELNGDGEDVQGEGHDLTAIDEATKRYFMQRFQSENSLIWLLSDHGTTWGPYATSAIGPFEMESPINILLSSGTLLGTEPRSNLEWNQDVLVSHADVYATLSAYIARLVAAEEPFTIGADLMSQRLPKDRTCSEAYIPQPHCVMRAPAPRECNVSSAEANEALSFVTRFVNKKLAAFETIKEYCRPLQPEDFDYEAFCIQQANEVLLELNMKSKDANFFARLSRSAKQEEMQVLTVVRSSSYVTGRCVGSLNNAGVGEVAFHMCVCR